MAGGKGTARAPGAGEGGGQTQRCEQRPVGLWEGAVSTLMDFMGGQEPGSAGRDEKVGWTTL